jgi:hypothetical protein
MLTPPVVIANAFEMTTEIDESQIQDDIQRKIGNKVNCVSSISFKPQPLSNSSPNSFHLSLSRERLGFSMTTAPRVFYVGDKIPIDPEPPNRVIVLTLSLPLIKMTQPTSFNLGSPKERMPSSTVTLPWVEPPPHEPPDRGSCIVAANKSINHFQSNIVAATLEIPKEDAHGYSNVKVILPMCTVVTNTLRFSMLLNEFTRDRDLKYVLMLLEPIIQHELHSLFVQHTLIHVFSLGWLVDIARKYFPMGEAWQLGYHRFKQNKDSIVLFWVYSAQKVFAEMSGQSIVSWLTFILGVLTSTYGWEVYTYALYDAFKYCILFASFQARSLKNVLMNVCAKCRYNMRTTAKLVFLKSLA